MRLYRKQFCSCRVSPIGTWFIHLSESRLSDCLCFFLFQARSVTNNCHYNKPIRFALACIVHVELLLSYARTVFLLPWQFYEPPSICCEAVGFLTKRIQPFIATFHDQNSTRLWRHNSRSRNEVSPEFVAQYAYVRGSFVFCVINAGCCCSDWKCSPPPCVCHVVSGVLTAARATWYATAARHKFSRRFIYIFCCVVLHICSMV